MCVLPRTHLTVLKLFGHGISRRGQVLLGGELLGPFGCYQWCGLPSCCWASAKQALVATSVVAPAAVPCRQDSAPHQVRTLMLLDSMCFQAGG